jgi:hypothetical protein
MRSRRTEVDTVLAQQLAVGNQLALHVAGLIAQQHAAGGVVDQAAVVGRFGAVGDAGEKAVDVVAAGGGAGLQDGAGGAAGVLDVAVEAGVWNALLEHRNNA